MVDQPSNTPSAEAGHSGIHGWHGECLETGEPVLAHWHAHHGHLVLTDRRLILLSHPHIPTLRREVVWTTPLEEIHELEVTRGAEVPSARYAASISTGSAPDSRAGGSNLGAAGIEEPTLPGSFELVADEMILYKGNPGPAQDMRDRIDEALVKRRVALGLMAKDHTPAKA